MPEHEIELIDNWGTPDSVLLGYEIDMTDAGLAEWETAEAGVRITHWWDGEQWHEIDGPWTLLAPDYSDGSEVQEYAGWVLEQV